MRVALLFYMPTDTSNTKVVHELDALVQEYMDKLNFMQCSIVQLVPLINRHKLKFEHFRKKHV